MNSLIVIGKHTKTTRNKNTQTFKWSTQGGDFLTTYTKNVELVIPELDATKSVTWSFHVDDSQKNSRYDMIIGRYLLLEPKVDLCFSNYTIRGNGGVYEGFTVSMKDPSNLRDYTIFRNEELWESEHVLESM